MMTKIKRTQPVILLVLMALALLATACSPSAAEKLNNDGNEDFEKQAYENALASYQTAQIKEPELAEPYYNAANTLYRQGQYEAALEQLNMALSFADEESLAKDGLFNLGNTSFNMQDLGTAVAAYTESLLLNPDDQDAKYNLELALQEQEQEQEQEEQEQEQSEDGQEGEEEQEEQSEGGEGEQEQEEQEPGEEESDQGQEGEQEQEEQSEGDQSQDGEEGEEQDQEGQPQSGQEDENQEQEAQPSQVPAPGQKMTEEQAEQLLAAIADDSQTLQEKLGQIFAVPWSPPAQDW